MSKCTLAVTIDGWQAMGDVAPTYSVGASVSGTVHVWVAERVRCDGLDVQLEPVSTTRGYGVGPAEPALRLFQGEWEAGEYEYRFSLPGPSLPSYSGRHVGWQWVVRARADIPWALDPEGASALQIVLSEPPTELDITAAADPPSAPPRRGWIGALTALFLLAVVVTAGAALCSYLEIGSEDLTDNVGGAGIVLLLVSLIALGKVSRGDTTSSSLDQVRVIHRPASESYRSGAPASIECDVKPRSGVDVAAIDAQLVVMEYAEWTTTQNEHTQTHRKEHVFHRGEAALAFDAPTGSWRGALRLPELTSVPCFSRGNPPGRGVVWKVELETSLRGKKKPEVTRRFLDVRPRLR